mgnify:CR=1 FL=1
MRVYLPVTWADLVAAGTIRTHGAGHAVTADVRDAEQAFFMDNTSLIFPKVESEYWKAERAQRAVVGTLWPGAFYS